MKFDHDVVVIGSGTAAYMAAHPLAKAGKRVTVIDRQPFGGTCAMRGCQPKKFLVTAAETAALASQLQGRGLVGKPAIDWPALMRQKRGFTGAVPERTEQGFRNAGIETVHGHARFVGPNTVQVGERKISGEFIIIATGARPGPMSFRGAEHLVSSDVFLDLEQLPERILFVGGGYISMEFACVAAVAGAEVTILETLDWPLPGFDPDMVGVLLEAMAEAGIVLNLETPVQGIEPLGGRFRVQAGVQGDQEFLADLVVHGAGRVPDLAGLDLERAGVAFDSRGVLVDEHMRSVSNSAVYCVGDAAAAGPKLAPVADMQGEVAAANILGGHRRAEYDSVPSIVFTLPPLAGVGATEAELEARGVRMQINRGDASGWPSSRRIGQRHAAYKVILEESSRRILGAHLIGHNAGEMINLFALGMKHQLTADDLKAVLWGYPTNTSDIKYMLG